MNDTVNYAKIIIVTFLDLILYLNLQELTEGSHILFTQIHQMCTFCPYLIYPSWHSQ